MMTKISALLLALIFGSAVFAETCNVIVKRYGELPGGEAVQIYRLKNANGMIAEITNYGGIITRLTTPDRKGRQEDVVLGYSRLEDYLAATPYFGAIVGPYGNRIADGKFKLEGESYQLTNNSDS